MTLQCRTFVSLDWITIEMGCRSHVIFWMIDNDLTVSRCHLAGFGNRFTVCLNDLLSAFSCEFIVSI